MNPGEIKSVEIDAETFPQQKSGFGDGIVTSREKNLIIIAFVFGLMVLCLLCAIIMTIVVGLIIPEPDYCHSAHCVKKAGSILRTMNTSANPCTDFYSFACGGWVDEYDVDEDSETAIMGTLQMKIYRKFDKIIESVKASLTPSEEVTEAGIKAIKTYESCSNMYNDYHPENVLPFMNKFGGWPMAQENWSLDATLTIEERLATIIGDFGYAPLFMISVQALEDDPSKNIIVLSPPIPMTLTGNPYLKTIMNVAENIGGNKYKINADESELLDLDREILEQAGSSTMPEKTERFKISQLNGKFDGMNFDWVKFFTLLLEEKVSKGGITTSAVSNTTSVATVSTSPVSTNSNISTSIVSVAAPTSTTISNPAVPSTTSKSLPDISNLKIHVKNKETINEILKIAYQKRNSRAFYNYFAINAVVSNPLLIVKDLDPGSSNKPVENNMNNVLTNLKANCFQTISQYLNFAMDHVFIYHQIKSTDKARDLITYIKNAFRRLLYQYHWLETSTRTALLRKLSNMNSFIDYPPWLAEKEHVNKYYKNYEYDGSNAVAAYINMMRFGIYKSLETYKEINNRMEWPKVTALTVSTVNAFYIPTQNNFILPRAILNPPIYDEDNPWYLTFGSIGAIIGHEITHGFDSHGKDYDENGKKASIWDPKSTHQYEKLRKCFVDQYSEYLVDPQSNIKVNGNDTLAENIADNGGLREAFKAYKLWLNDHKNKKELPLPGLGQYSSEQMFFISYGQTWCISAGKDFLKQQVKTDEHTPNNYRVIGTLSNMVEFANVFQCPKESRMNPTNKCIIW